MTEIKLTKRYPNSRTEDIVDAYMRGWNDALDAVQNGKFHISDTPQTETKIETQNLNSTFKFERTIEIDGDVVRYGEWEFTGQTDERSK